MSRSAYEKIAEGLAEALAVARGDATPARTVPNPTRAPVRNDFRPASASREAAGGRGATGRSTRLAGPHQARDFGHAGGMRDG
jgi:hypothetical protein